MNILFVIHTQKSPYSAVYNSCHQLAAYLEEQGCRATILAPQDFASLRRWHSRWLPLLYPFWVARWLSIRNGHYDLAVFHSYAGWVVNLLRKLVPSYRRLRTVTTSHGLEPLYYNALKEVMEKAGQPLRLRFRLVHGILMPWLLRLSCRRSDRIVCLTRKEATYVERNNWGHKAKISVFSHGVHREFFVRRQYARKARRLLFVAQWQEGKGIRYLVEAFRMLAREAPKLELWCVGTLLEKERVLAAFPEEVRSRVSVRPHVGQKELVEVYRDADVFLFPSLYEGFGKVLVEAMATALPIVSTPVGAALDLLETGINALIVPKYDAMALAKSVRRLLDDVTLRERLGRQAQATAADYELERVHKRFIVLFEDLLVSAETSQR